MLLEVINNHQTVVEGVNIFYSLCFVLIKLISRFIQLSSPIMMYPNTNPATFQNKWT